MRLKAQRTIDLAARKSFFLSLVARPAWLNGEMLKILVEKYDIRLINTPEEDIERMMG
jgi:hydroxylamine reductase (hybrid-cluster protein)